MAKANIRRLDKHLAPAALERSAVQPTGLVWGYCTHTIQTGNLDNSSEPRYLTSNLPFACFAQSIAGGCLEDCVCQNIVVSLALAFPSSHLQAKPNLLHAAANQPFL